MGKKRIDSINKLKEIYKKYDSSINSKSVIEPSVYLDSAKAEHVFNKYRDRIIANYLNKVGFSNVDKIIKAFPSINKDELNNSILKAIKKTNDYVLHNEELTNYLDSDKTIEEKIKYGLELTSNTSKKDSLKTVITRSINESIKINSIDDLEKNIDNILTNGEIDEEELIPNDDIFSNPIDHGKEDDVFTKANEIEALKQENSNDKEYIEVLNKANSYCTSGNPSTVSLQSDVAENMGKLSLKLEIKDASEYINKNGNDKTAFDFSQQTIIFNKNASKEEIENMVKYSVNNFPKLDDMTKAKFVNIEEYVKNFTDTDDLKGLGTFKLLDKAREDLEAAIDSKNKEQIIEATKNYEKTYGFYKNLLEYCNALTSDNRFPNNMSAARDASVPFEFRNDVKGTSILRCVSTMLQECKRNNISMRELVDNPIETSRKFVENYKKTATVDNYVKNMTIVDSLNRLYKNPSNIYVEEVNKMADISSTFIVLSSIIEGENKGSIRANGNTFARGYLEKQEITPAGFVKNPIAVANLIAADPSDRSLRDLDNTAVLFDDNYELTEFNLEKYIRSGKTSPENIAIRLSEVTMAKTNTDGEVLSGNVNKNVVNEAISINVNKLLNMKDIELSETTRSVLEKINNNTFTKLSKTDELIMKKEGVINNSIRCSNSMNHINTNVNALADLKKDYNRRNIFLKIFGPETRKLNRAINGLTNKLVENGIKADELNSKLNLAMNNNLENEVIAPQEEAKAVAEEKVEKTTTVIDLDDDVEDKKIIEVKEAKDEVANDILDLDDDVAEENLENVK